MYWKAVIEYRMTAKGVPPSNGTWCTLNATSRIISRYYKNPEDWQAARAGGSIVLSTQNWKSCSRWYVIQTNTFIRSILGLNSTILMEVTDDQTVITTDVTPPCCEYNEIYPPIWVLTAPSTIHSKNILPYLRILYSCLCSTMVCAKSI